MRLLLSIAAALLATTSIAQPAVTAPGHEAPAEPLLLPAWPEAASRETAQPWPRIEQVRRGNRITEVRVSSGSGEHRYTMVNREGRPPLSSQELSSGLSAPRFIRIEF